MVYRHLIPKLNIFQAYLAFYVINDLQMAESAKALVCNKFCPF